MCDEGVARWILRLAPLLVVLGWWSATALATGAPGDPKEAFRKQDVAWAKQINLRRSDLPTGVKWTAYGTGGTGGGGSGGNDVGCPGVRSDNSDLTLTGRALSPFVDFVLGQHGRATAWLLLHGAPIPIPTDVEAGFVRLMAG